MTEHNHKRLFLLLLFLFSAVANAQQPERMQDRGEDEINTINPLDYGLLQAADGKARYEVLYRCHNDAYNNHVSLSYAGIDTIRLDIPDDAKSLPLPYRTDFAGVVFFVRNDSDKDVTLFRMVGDGKATPFDAERWMIDSGDFSSVDALANGDFLVVVADNAPWTSRIGYDYEVFRRDLLYVRDGKSINRPIATYSNPAAKPTLSFVPVNTVEKRIENLTIHRERNCKHKTYCINVSNQNNVLIRNVLITTPKGKFIADAAISISNSSNCRIVDVTVDSTYSVPGSYGYAMSLNNVWNTTFERFVADGAWGVFGTNNVSNTTLRQCDVNRFDIHCYGRDVRCVDCTFRNKQTQFSSMYGDVVFDSCHFIDCIPVRIRSSYNAYTPFDIYFRHCTFDATLRHHALVNVMLLATEANARPELSARCWPNVIIDDMTVNLPFLTRRLDIIDPTGTVSECRKPVDYMSKITINGLRIVRNGKAEYCDIYYSKRRFNTSSPLMININNVDKSGGRIVNLINTRKD